MPHCGVLGEACAVCSPAVLLPATCAGVDNRELNLNNKLLTGEATRPVLKINDFTYRWGLVCKRGEMRLSALGCCTDAGPRGVRSHGGAACQPVACACIHSWLSIPPLCTCTFPAPAARAGRLID